MAWLELAQSAVLQKPNFHKTVEMAIVDKPKKTHILAHTFSPSLCGVKTTQRIRNSPEELETQEIPKFKSLSMWSLFFADQCHDDVFKIQASATFQA